MIEEAPIDIIIAADYDRTTGRYGQRGIRYVHMEVGHVGQNISLQANALSLGTVMIGAFEDKQVKEIMGIEEEPLISFQWVKFEQAAGKVKKGSKCHAELGSASHVINVLETLK